MCPPTQALADDGPHQSRAMLAIVIGVVLGTACWATLALLIFYGPARDVALKLWPLVLIPLAGVVTQPTRARRRTRWEPTAPRQAS